MDLFFYLPHSLGILIDERMANTAADTTDIRFAASVEVCEVNKNPLID